jgi:hypothetical protein
VPMMKNAVPQLMTWVTPRPAMISQSGMLRCHLPLLLRE